jgi:hypothetical protein
MGGKEGSGALQQMSETLAATVQQIELASVALLHRNCCKGIQADALFLYICTLATLTILRYIE